MRVRLQESGPIVAGVWSRDDGGSVMAVYDVNGDGLNDVVNSLNAHSLAQAEKGYRR